MGRGAQVAEGQRNMGKIEQHLKSKALYKNLRKVEIIFPAGVSAFWSS